MSKPSIIVGSLSFVWLLMAVLSVAQNPAVLDTDGHALQVGVQYFIRPANSSFGGRFTLISRNTFCPLYVGVENFDSPSGFPVIITPFLQGETVVRERRDFKIVFSVTSECAPSSAWMLGPLDALARTSLILAGSGTSPTAANYFRIVKNETTGQYNFDWCPTEVCPLCHFNCGSLGSTVLPGHRFLALGGSALPVIFQKAK